MSDDQELPPFESETGAIGGVVSQTCAQKWALSIGIRDGV